MWSVARRAASASLGTALCWILGSSTATASPADLFGFGPRSQALAGTGTSYQGGPFASYSNPALLSRVPERAFVLGFHAAQFEFEARGDLQDPPPGESARPMARSFADDSDAVLFGLSAPLTAPAPISDRLVLGLAASTPTRSIARVQILNESAPQFPFLGPRSESLNLSLGLGARLPFGVSIGLGTLILASLHGGVTVDAGEDGTLESVTDDALELDAAPVYGIAITPEDSVAFGMVYRSELRSEFDLVVSVDNLGALTIPPLQVNGLPQIDPAQLQWEFSVESDAWRLIAGATYRRWSSIERFKDPTVRCPTDAELGAEAEAAGTEVREIDCTEPARTDLGLANTLTPRIALERRVRLSRAAQGALRAGYFYEPSPLPSAEAGTRILDADRHVVSAGYEISLANPWPPLRVAFAVQWHDLVEREHRLRRPPGAASDAPDPGASSTASGQTRDPSTAEAAPRRATLTSGGQIWSLALAAEVRF